METEISTSAPSEPRRVLVFGSFELHPAQQQLLDSGVPVPLGTRALHILDVLAARAGEVVTKDQLMALVWPGTFVEESNLRVHISALRKVLRDGQAGVRYILNVPGRGYSFAAPVQIVEAAKQDSPPPELAWTLSFPAAPPRIFGREAVVDLLTMQLAQRRFITLVGPGGIGKTTVAVAAARQLAASYRDGICFVDFSSIRGRALVPSAIGSAIGLASRSEDVMSALLAFTARRSMLLVLDNCEHIIEEAANVAEQLSAGALNLHLLCTSREPLRAAGERVHRLQALDCPPESDGLTADQALTFPGVQLLVERVSAGQQGFCLEDAEAPLAAEICQRLDGIALAIELAAARVPALGLRELATRLDDRFRLLISGRRTALPRHQTLAATLDWSYDLLPSIEQEMLCRLSVFAGEFSLDATIAIAHEPDPAAVVDHLADLVAKSLVVAEARAGTVRYRLLDTTRLYAAGKLRLDDRVTSVRRAHADYMLTLLGSAERDIEFLPTAEWVRIYGSQLDNLRSALDWAGSAEGNTALLVSLTVGGVPLWGQLSLMAECCTRAEMALAVLDPRDATTARTRMQLSAAVGWSLMYGAGRSGQIGTAWATTLELATALGDSRYRLRAMWGGWISKLNSGDLDTALDMAKLMLDLVAESSDPGDLMMADRLMATTLHYRGDQLTAQMFMDRAFGRQVRTGTQPWLTRFNVDQQVTARFFQARIGWLRGDVDQAVATVERNVAEGRELGNALSFSSVLGQAACPIALFTGDLPRAQQHAAALLEHSEKHAMHLWHVWARCFAGLVAFKRGQIAVGLQDMRSALESAGENRFLPRYMLLLAEYGFATAVAGNVGAALEILDGMLERCERSRERWYVPELMRLRGEVVLLAGEDSAADAAAHSFEAAIALAEAQGARSWQLRAATSLASVRQGSREATASRERLAAIYVTFTEGLQTADLEQARALLTV